MKHLWTAAALALATAFGVVAFSSAAAQHRTAAPKVARQAGEAAAPLDRADPHVAQLFNILRRARADGDMVDMARLQERLRDVGRAHASEYGIDQAASEKMILQTAHKAWMAAIQHPESLGSLEAFNKSIGASLAPTLKETEMKRMEKLALAAGALAILAGPAQAQHAPPGGKPVELQGLPPPDQREQMMKPFYEVLLEAHKQGEKVDLDAMEARVKALMVQLTGEQKPSRELEDHILGVAHQALALGVSNPRMFDSYKSFTAAMMGPS